MKKFAKLFVAVLAVIMVMAVFAATAAAQSAEIVDPNTLKPGSDRVLFIKDGPRDASGKPTGELDGDGSGLDAANPLKPQDHESFDPTAAAPKWHLQTAFYQATELLKDEGGTIVVCGPVYFGPYESYGSGSTTRDVFTASFKTNTIKITSVYNGVDYRETAGAKIIVDTPAEIGMYGQSIWENIDIETAAAGRVISFDCWPTLVGEGVKCYPSDPAFEGVAGNYISLSAGHRYGKSLDVNSNLLVKSGSYNVITGAMWGVVDSQTNENCNVNLTLEGTTTVYGQIIGTTGQKGKFSGNVNITINGGTYECDINGIGVTGMLNTDGVVKLNINGGDFTNAWSINTASTGYQNNGPALATIDFTGWKGDITALAKAFGAITDFEDIKLPIGVTQQQLLDALKAAETTVPATTAPETTAAPDKETEKAPEATKAPEVEETKANTPVETPDEEGGSNIGLIIGIVAAVVVIAAILLVVLKKKKK